MKTLNAFEFILKHGNPHCVQRLSIASNLLQGLCTFTFNEGGIERGKSIRDKAHLLNDLIHNPHKLEIERHEALEYRKKFYPTSNSFAGTGAGSFGSATYKPSNFSGNNPSDVKVYSPYVEGTPSSSTYNITNNNNINYNYGSNITAISSDNNQSHMAPASTLNKIGGAISAVTSSEYVTNATKYVASSNVL